MNFKEEYSNYLMHHGVKGMKWGRRKSQAKNYKDEQVRRDIAMYGKSGARKINDYMLKGDSYSTARHKMGASRYKQASAKKYAGSALQTIGGIGLSAISSQSASFGNGMVLGVIGGSSIRKSGSKKVRKYRAYA